MYCITVAVTKLLFRSFMQHTSLFSFINPNWHELWEQEKCSSLAPPRDISYKTQWVCQGVKLTRLMSICTSKKVWKFFVKIQLTKSDPKRTGGGKCPASCQLGLRQAIQILVRQQFWVFCSYVDKSVIFRIVLTFNGVTRFYHITITFETIYFLKLSNNYKYHKKNRSHSAVPVTPQPQICY